MKKVIGNRLRALRERNAMTCADLALKSGVSERQIHRIEQGESSPKASTLASLAAAFNTDAAQFLLGRDNGEIEELIADNTCSYCGSRLVQRVDVPHEYGDEEFDMFECGSTRGWRDRPCPEDPSFPKFEDYELVFLEDGGRWSCLPRGKTKEASAVDLDAGHGPTREAAARWVERSYTCARYGHAVAQRNFPFAEMMAG
jgi:transcriptional regulator with XRE-family HTH domain